MNRLYDTDITHDMNTLKFGWMKMWYINAIYKHYREETEENYEKFVLIIGNPAEIERKVNKKFSL
jgi:hypothetical protein